MMSPIAPNFVTTAGINVHYQKWGNGANQVISGDTSGEGRRQTGFMLPKIDGTSVSGSQLFGADYFYQYISNELCPVVGGNWLDGASAGVWGLSLNSYRASSGASVGARAGLFL